MADSSGGDSNVGDTEGVWAAGARLAAEGVLRVVTPPRRRILLVTVGVVALVFVVGAVIGLFRGPATALVTIGVLFATGALVAYLVVGAEMVLWALADRRRVAEAPLDPVRGARLHAEVLAGRAALLDPADRRALVRFARVQQVALPATVLVHALGVSVGVVLLVMSAFGGLGGIVIAVVGLLVVAVSAWSLRGAVRALGSTPELVALEG